MNYIWCAIIIVSIAVSVMNGSADETVKGAIEGAQSAVTTVISFTGAMCFWTGIMKIAEKCGLFDRVKKILRPVVSFLFPGAGDEAKKYISMNMSANLLGMGNAATPMGIKAMSCLDRENPDPVRASDNMCMLVVVNTASIQIIPTTVISLRAAAGSADPFSVIIPIWITSLLSLFISVMLLKAYLRIKR